MAFTIPTVDDFKANFTRDFPYGAGIDYVQDNDISKALVEAGINFNQSLFSTQETFSLGYLYLTAHFLVMDLRAASQGISGSYPWMTTSKSVGGVSEGIEVPEFIKNNPLLAMYSKTYYGAKYLTMVLPRITGPFFASYGGTQA